jgi:pyridoxamine 5'-phosphate oxidase
MEIESNPNAALTFWWGDLERSVRIEGVVQKVSSEESTAYFKSRPMNSQIGAWSSSQSQPINSREDLESQEAAIIKRFESSPITRPEHWGGYRLSPSKIEFWKGREGRLHDRILYERHSKLDATKPMNDSSTWKRTRLQP